MTTTLVAPDYSAIKERQRMTWASGDYAVVGTTLQIVGERLCAAVDIRAGERVIDVAAGDSNTTLAAARQFVEVTSSDHVGLCWSAARSARLLNVCTWLSGRQMQRRSLSPIVKASRS